MKSNCCNAPLVEETDVCSECHEHCEDIETKRYMVELDANFEMEVVIFQNEATKKILHEINNFWGGSGSRLSNNDGCIDKTVCDLMASEVVRHQARTSFNESLESVIEAFKEGIEGFYPVDGSCGIEIVEIGIPFSPSDLDFFVHEDKSPN